MRYDERYNEIYRNKDEVVLMYCRKCGKSCYGQSKRCGKWSEFMRQPSVTDGLDDALERVVSAWRNRLAKKERKTQHAT